MIASQMRPFIKKKRKPARPIRFSHVLLFSPTIMQFEVFDLKIVLCQAFEAF